jgi:RecB family endonuclease NucS
MGYRGTILSQHRAQDEKLFVNSNLIVRLKLPNTNACFTLQINLHKLNISFVYNHKANQHETYVRPLSEPDMKQVIREVPND